MKNLVWNVIGIAALSVGCGVVMVQVSLLLGILLLAGGVLCGFILNNAFTEEVMKWITIATFAMMIPLSPFGAAKIGEYGKWQFETSNAALPRPKKEEEVDKRSQHEKNMENLMQLVVENTGKILENQGETKREEEEKETSSKKGREDAERDFENGDTSKMKQIPETERTLPQIVIPEDIPGQTLPRTVPEKPEPQKPATPPEPEGERGPAKGFQIPTQKDDMPKAEPIPQTGPKQPTPELRAKVTPPEKKKGRPTFVVCSCKNCKDHKHPITDWYDFDKDGVPEPVYDPCFFAETGKAACSFKDWAWEE